MISGLTSSRKVVDYNLTEAQVKVGYEKCIENVQNLLDSAELLLKNESQQYALGLYLYAIEEFGKAEILKDRLNGSTYTIPDWVFGKGKNARKGHDRKFGEGIKRLPPSCRRLSRIMEITYNNSEVAQTFMIEKEGVPIGSISVPPYVTGTFEDTNIPKKTVDLDLKAACFYVDWDDTNGEWKYVLPADKNQLTDNIKRMRDVVSG